MRNLFWFCYVVPWKNRWRANSICDSVWKVISLPYLSSELCKKITIKEQKQITPVRDSISFKDRTPRPWPFLQLGLNSVPCMGMHQSSAGRPGMRQQPPHSLRCWIPLALSNAMISRNALLKVAPFPHFLLQASHAACYLLLLKDLPACIFHTDRVVTFMLSDKVVTSKNRTQERSRLVRLKTQKCLFFFFSFWTLHGLM